MTAGQLDLGLALRARPVAALRSIRIRPSVVFSVAVLALAALATISPSLLTHGDPLAGNPALSFQAPSLAHPAGTDLHGRDVLVRIIHGARYSTLIGLGAPHHPCQETIMTTTLSAPPEAGPVDFETYGTIYAPRGGAQLAPYGTTDAYPFRGRITTDGPFVPAANRYHLFVSLACPFAHRTLIVRALKGLEDVIGVSVVDPIRDGRGWAFRTGRGQTLDTSGSGFAFLSEAYEASSPHGYTGRVSVPVLWDTLTRQVVSNHFPDITIDLGSRFDPWARHPEVDLYPQDLRSQLDALNDHIGEHVNSGVYHAGFARTQAE